MEAENILANIVRLGTVSAVDSAARTARVIYEDRAGMVSGWLHVLQHNGAGINVAQDGEHTHLITDTYTGGGTASTVPEHGHGGSRVTYWMPSVGDTVVVLYLPVSNGDGFILGAI